MSAVKAPPTLDDYTIVIFRDDKGTFVASVPSVEACYAIGATRAEALDELAGVFEMCRELGEELPDDSVPRRLPLAG